MKGPGLGASYSSGAWCRAGFVVKRARKRADRLATARALPGGGSTEVNERS